MEGNDQKQKKRIFSNVKDAKKKNTKRTAAGIPTWSPTVVLICRSHCYMHGRADGMPSFQLTVAVRTCLPSDSIYEKQKTSRPLTAQILKEAM
jgi:hypothetical protein